jgi:hypothetical protein
VLINNKEITKWLLVNNAEKDAKNMLDIAIHAS